MRKMRLLLVGFALLGATPAVAEELAYGAAPLQRLDLYPAKQAHRARPLIVFIHGGGWSRGDKGNATGAAKIAHFNANGWSVASINYRLVPAARVEDSAADVAAAIAYLRANAARLRLDAGRIVVMGHSAGAHLAALVATDPRYFAAAKVPMSAIAGVVLLDGAGYDVPGQLADAGPLLRRTYSTAFGDDPNRQRALSPTLRASRPNASRFLILHIDRPDSRQQSEALARALTDNGTAAQVRGVEGRGRNGHMEINHSLGRADYPATRIVDDWLAKLR